MTERLLNPADPECSPPAPMTAAERQAYEKGIMAARQYIIDQGYPVDTSSEELVDGLAELARR